MSQLPEKRGVLICANNWVYHGLQIMFVCLQITLNMSIMQAYLKAFYI